MMNNQNLKAPAGATLLSAAKGIGVNVPALCWSEGLEHVTSCMLCVVEDCRTGTLLPACSTLVEEGMQIASDSDAVVEARRMALELLLGDHLGDCEGPCRRACAAGMDIPEMLRQIARGNWQQAARVVTRSIALPAILGRICPAPCEKVCRRQAHDAPVGICMLKRFVADTDLACPGPYQPDIATPSGFRVAIVGGGPAGLAASYELMRAGHTCTLFEKQSAPGGGLRAAGLHGALPVHVLDTEIEQIVRLGLQLKINVEIGVDLTIEELKQEFDAVILACGEVSPERIEIPGIARSAHGVSIDHRTHGTSDPLVFACGNVVSPGRLAVRALGQGRSTALAVDRMLRGEPASGIQRNYDHRISGRLEPEETATLMAATCAGEHIAPAGGSARGSSEDEARVEAMRCMHCDCRKSTACLLRRYAGEYNVKTGGWKPEKRRRLVIERHGDVIYEPGKCIACGICVRITSTAKEPLGLTFIGRGFDVRIGTPLTPSLEAGLGSVAADCIAACPTAALSTTNIET